MYKTCIDVENTQMFVTVFGCLVGVCNAAVMALSVGFVDGDCWLVVAIIMHGANNVSHVSLVLAHWCDSR